VKYVVWVLAVVAFALMVYFVVDFARHRKASPGGATVSADVGPDSIAAYEQRIVDLEAGAAGLRQRMDRAGTLGRPDVQERLRLLEADVENLRAAVARWKVEHNRANQGEAYRQCILLYGKASGVCQSLAPDTVASPGGK
jgi:hypothetical protein